MAGRGTPAARCARRLHAHAHRRPAAGNGRHRQLDGVARSGVALRRRVARRALVRDARQSVRRAALRARRGGGSMSAQPRRVLVVTAGKTEGLPETIHERVARTHAEVLVVTPAANSRLRHWVSDVDNARRVAEERVWRCVEHLRLSGFDAWHADAGGVYSGVAGNSGPFLRGVQKTDRNGLAVFDTIYPGWYQGRAVHIHVKVHAGGNVVHTGQLFFPDALTDQVYKAAPYRARGNPDVADTADSIYRNGGSRSLLHPVKSGSGYLASMVMGVHTG